MQSIIEDKVVDNEAGINDWVQIPKGLVHDDKGLGLF